MRYTGVILGLIQNRDYVRSKIDFLFSKIASNLEDEIQRQGFAQAVGLCAKGHLDLLLEKLQSIVKSRE